MARKSPWLALVLLASACTSSSGTDAAATMDLAQTPHDLAMGAQDLAMGAQDLAMGAQDLAMGAQDLATNGATVMVGMGGRKFTPGTVQIGVGQTVTWQWASGGHTVTSGTNGTPDNKFCSPNDQNCATAAASNAGATYSHTFNQAGAYPYFCRPHAGAGMTGTIMVQ